MDKVGELRSLVAKREWSQALRLVMDAGPALRVDEYGTLEPQLQIAAKLQTHMDEADDDGAEWIEGLVEWLESIPHPGDDDGTGFLESLESLRVHGPAEIDLLVSDRHPDVLVANCGGLWWCVDSWMGNRFYLGRTREQAVETVKDAWAIEVEGVQVGEFLLELLDVDEDDVQTWMNDAMLALGAVTLEANNV